MMSKSDSTPEKKVHQLLRLQDCTVCTAEEATIYVCDLDMLVEVQLLKESHPELSLGNCAKKTVVRMKTSRSAIISHHEWENIELENRQPHSLTFILSGAEV